MTLAPGGKPRWQRDPIFKFLASLKLAMLLLAVLIAASIFGTIYESSFNAKVARAYIYNAQWFNLWLVLLAVNLACAAFSRMPWKKHHTAFLITHLGIIVLLIGGLIDRIWGIEGSITLHKGEKPSNVLNVDERVLQITEGPQFQSVPVEILNRRPTPESPRSVTKTASGAKVSLIGYSPELVMSMEPKVPPQGGIPAIHLTMATGMMNQNMESWLMADHPEHGVYDLGLAQVIFRHGTAPVAEPKAEAKPVEIQEAVFAFANVADPINRSLKGGSTGALVSLTNVGPDKKGTIVVTYKSVTRRFELAESLGKSQPVEGTPFQLEVRDYWPDFRIQDGKPSTLSEQPNNPAVLVFLSGVAEPVAVKDHSAPPADGSPNRLTIFVNDDGALTYELFSRKAGKSSGSLELGKPLVTGWADWTLTINKQLPKAIPDFTAKVLEGSPGMNQRMTQGIRVRVSRGEKAWDQWVPFGWQVGVPSEPQSIRLTYGISQYALPISLSLKEFEVQRNEGTDSPAGFKSTLEVTDAEGKTVSGQCWMNNPMNFPDSWINTWSGLTFKISQASWNPQNLNESTVQILRDPGWFFKWTGSLLIVCGIFMLFYLPQFRRKMGGNRVSQ